MPIEGADERAGKNGARNSARRRRNARKHSQKESAMYEGTSARGELLSFTFDTKTGSVVKIEKVDSAGARHELSEADKTRLAKLYENGGIQLEDLLEESFEAGIACLFGGKHAHEAEQESAEEAELRRLLLLPLMEHSPAGRLRQPDVLGRAVLASLIRRSIAPPPTGRARSAH